MRHHITLALTTLLHGFTHAYGQVLVPVYLLMVADLKLAGVGKASLIVTIYGLVYNLGSYGAGVLSDRFNRKNLLGIGLLGNAIAIGAMGFTRQYEMLLLLGIIAGIFGTLFHPCANAMIPAHYPKSPGMAIGLLGMGSGIGFFFGPQYSGWRAQTASWQFHNIAAWQRPCVEMGIMGLIVGVIFLIFAKEARSSTPSEAMLPGRLGIEAIVTDLRGQHDRITPKLRRLIIAIAAVLGFRDFTGVASISLLSIYLQKAFGYSTQRAGFIIGAMTLVSIIMNPLATFLTPGKRRLPALRLVLWLGGISLIAVPYLPVIWVLPVMCIFESFQFGSYAISDAAMLERVSPHVRGRVVGLFLTLAGTFAALSPWAMGFWTDLLGSRASQPHAYEPIFITLAAMMVLASFVPPLLEKLENTDGRISELQVATAT